MIRIPFKALPAFREELLIDNVPYIFEFLYNSRASFWTLNIYTIDEVLLIAGIKLVINYELLKQYPARGLPTGSLYVVRENLSMKRLEQSELEQDKAFIVYQEESENVTV